MKTLYVKHPDGKHQYKVVEPMLADRTDEQKLLQVSEKPWPDLKMTSTHLIVKP